MAFSAVRSICFIGSPPAPMPRFGCGCFSVFRRGVICFCMLFLHWMRRLNQLVCLVIGGRYCFVLLLFDKGFCGLFCVCVRACNGCRPVYLEPNMAMVCVGIWCFGLLL